MKKYAKNKICNSLAVIFSTLKISVTFISQTAYSYELFQSYKCSKNLLHYTNKWLLFLVQNRHIVYLFIK